MWQEWFLRLGQYYERCSGSSIAPSSVFMWEPASQFEERGWGVQTGCRSVCVRESMKRWFGEDVKLVHEWNALSWLG